MTNRAAFSKAVSQVARLIYNLLGKNINLNIQIDETGAKIYIPYVEKDVTSATAQVAVVPPDAEPEPAQSADTGKDHRPTNEPTQVPANPQKRRTVTLDEDRFKAELDRLLGIAGTISGDKDVSINLIPWLEGKQIGQLISALCAAGYKVKTWKQPPENGKPPKFLHDSSGAARIFVKRAIHSTKQSQPEEMPAAAEIPPVQENPVEVVALDPR